MINLDAKNYTIRRTFACDAMYELSVDHNDYNYLIIYGRHINGYYCAIPNWMISVEMAGPNEIGYNAHKLVATNIISEEAAYIVAQSISDHHNNPNKPKPLTNEELYAKYFK